MSAALTGIDDEVREVLVQILINLDPEAEYELRDDEFIAEFPQFGERVRGRDALRERQRAYPPDTAPMFRVRRIMGRGDIWTVEAVGDYGGKVFLGVAILELRHDKLYRETRYYPEPFEPPHEGQRRFVYKQPAGSL